jgi:GNAT superfamily N-acetyltransferase
MPVPKDDGHSAPLAAGYYKLPVGTLANACQFLEMTSPQRRATTLPSGVGLAQIPPDQPDRFRALFRAVGEPWLWASHLGKSDAEIVAMLSDPAMETLAVVRDHTDIGLIQLEHGVFEGSELVYFGLVPDEIGRGLGRRLIDEAIARAFARSQRLWLHTCNFDHPKALAFYRSAGFRLYATGFQVLDDPRALGQLPPTAAPHVPRVGP